MSYQPPSYLFWVLLAVAFCIAIFLTYRDIRKSIVYHDIAWEVNDNLSELFRKLVHTQNKIERDDIYASIERERNKLPDKKLDKMIRLFLDAETEREMVGMDSYSESTQYLLSLNNERIRNHIRSKYGERNYQTENKVQTV